MNDLKSYRVGCGDFEVESGSEVTSSSIWAEDVWADRLVFGESMRGAFELVRVEIGGDRIEVEVSLGYGAHLVSSGCPVGRMIREHDWFRIVVRNTSSSRGVVNIKLVGRLVGSRSGDADGGVPS
jgi:hypothetical protein